MSKFKLIVDGTAVRSFESGEQDSVLALLDRLALCEAFYMICVLDKSGREHPLLSQVVSGIYSIHGVGVFAEPQPFRMGTVVCKQRLQDIMDGSITSPDEGLTLDITIDGNSVFSTKHAFMYEMGLSFFVHQALSSENISKIVKWETAHASICVRQFLSGGILVWDMTLGETSLESTSPVVVYDIITGYLNTKNVIATT